MKGLIKMKVLVNNLNAFIEVIETPAQKNTFNVTSWKQILKVNGKVVSEKEIKKTHMYALVIEDEKQGYKISNSVKSPKAIDNAIKKYIEKYGNENFAVILI